MLDKNYLPDKVKNLKPYNTKKEKEILLAGDITPQKALEILSDVKALNEGERLYLLMKLREISVSDVVDGMINCPNCKAVNEFQIPLLKWIAQAISPN